MQDCMAVGPGKYDQEATAAFRATGASVILLAVIEGRLGSGFEVQCKDHDALHTVRLAKTLIEMAEQIASDSRVVLADTLEADHGTIHFARRPEYCDRGRVLVHVEPAHGIECSSCNLDGADGFPRYYFDELRAVAEVEAWMAARGWHKKP